MHQRFTEPERKICRRIFLQLAQPGEGTEDTKRRVSLRELTPATEDLEAIEAVIRVLSGPDARLITAESEKDRQGEQIAEVAHEALIRGWSRLREWIEQDRAALRTHRRLTEAVSEWQNSDKDESFLYRGTRLAQAEEWARTYADFCTSSIGPPKIARAGSTHPRSERKRRCKSTQWRPRKRC